MRSATRATVALLCSGLLCAASALSFVAAQAPLNILDFGAVAGDTSSEAAMANSKALIAAFTAASSSAAAARQGSKITPAQARQERWEAVLDYSRASYSDEGLASVAPSTMSRLFYTDSSSVEAGSSSSTVLVPAGLEFTIGWTVLSGFSNVLFQIQGTLVVSQNESLWNQAPDGDFGVLHFVGCSGLTIQGKAQTFNGTDPVPTSAIDVIGAGYSWWLNVILGKWDHRPHLFYLDQCVSMVMLSLYVTDSPQYHFLSNDGAEHFFKNIVVKVDVEAQSKMLEAGGYASLMSLAEGVDRVEGLVQSGLPLFPLNTDGIDPSSTQTLIEDFYIENFDDAIAVKPCQEVGPNSKFCQCAGDILARNGAVKFSVGLTIGSVPPHADVNCVRNVTFDSITMNLPFKMVYIKSNPGTVGRGIIDQITYSNIQAHSPLWYPIWIGPQQQKQPGNGSDTGCSFLYPLVSNNTCATQPLVTMSNIALYNVTASGGLTLPGVFLCDPTNPCTGVVMDSVSNEGTWLVSPNYVCHNVQGSQVNNNPPLNCMTSSSSSSLPPSALQEEIMSDVTAAN